MSKLFLSVLNMSLTASYVILFVILVRLLLKKAPKVFSYALWGVVAFRLIVPFSFESVFSLIPQRAKAVPIFRDIIYSQSSQINGSIEAVNSLVSNSFSVPTVKTSVNPINIYLEIGTYIWILGIIALLIYSFVSILLLQKKLKSAQSIERNIFEAKNLKTPFVLGFLRPKIYLPVGVSVEERRYILLHEQTHIRRKDHIIKILAFLILAIHWFNPLVWIAFRLMSTDMELSCDERVLKEMDEEIKKPYANSLLSLAAERHILNGSPLAFGEGNVKRRIVNVLNYKKPVFWVVIASLIVVVAVSVGLMSNPKGKQPSIEDYADKFIDMTIADYNTEDNYFKIVDKKITKLEKIASFDKLLPSTEFEIWSLEYRLKPEDMSKIMFAGGMNEVDGWITEECSMGKPVLVFAYENSIPQFLGTLWSGEADLSTPAGQEIALRTFLEARGILPGETSVDTLLQEAPATIEDFMKTPESEYIGFISNFQIDKNSKPSFHLDPIEWLTLEDTERLKELNINPDIDMPNGFYIYNPDSRPMFFQVAEDAKYYIINWKNLSHKSVSVEDFKEYIDQYDLRLFIIVTKDGYVQSITERYTP